MEEKERERPGHVLPAAGSGSAAGDGLDGARASAERLLQAADEAIASALSSDSEKFLQATRQSSGE